MYHAAIKIAIELPYYAFGGRGSYQYGVNLARGLAEIAKGHEIVVFQHFWRGYESHRAKLRAQLPENARLELPRWPQRLVRMAERAGYPIVERRLRALGIDVFHAAGPHVLDLDRTATVYTMHGTGLSLMGIEPSFRDYLPQLARYRRIIVHCKVNRDFLVKYASIPAERVDFIPFGLDHAVFKPIDDMAALETVRRKHSLPERFLLCIGPFQFRDNIEHVLVALDRLRSHPTVSPHHLVLAGGLEEHGRTLRAYASRLQIAEKVRFIGHVPHSELGAICNLATLLVHPSYYEELGTALREAAACGLPVLASAAGGNFEAIGDAAAFFNPNVLEELEAQLIRLLRSPDTLKEMSLEGVERCRGYTWEENARRTLDCYAAALAKQ